MPLQLAAAACRGATAAYCLRTRAPGCAKSKIMLLERLYAGGLKFLLFWSGCCRRFSLPGFCLRSARGRLLPALRVRPLLRETTACLCWGRKRACTIAVPGVQSVFVWLTHSNMNSDTLILVSPSPPWPALGLPISPCFGKATFRPPPPPRPLPMLRCLRACPAFNNACSTIGSAPIANEI